METIMLLDKSQLIEVNNAVLIHLARQGLFIVFEAGEPPESGQWVLGRGDVDESGRIKRGSGKPISRSVSYSALVEMALSFKKGGAV